MSEAQKYERAHNGLETAQICERRTIKVRMDMSKQTRVYATITANLKEVGYGG